MSREIIKNGVMLRSQPSGTTEYYMRTDMADVSERGDWEQISTEKAQAIILEDDFQNTERISFVEKMNA